MKNSLIALLLLAATYGTLSFLHVPGWLALFVAILLAFGWLCAKELADVLRRM